MTTIPIAAAANGHITSANGTTSTANSGATLQMPAPSSPHLTASPRFAEVFSTLQGPASLNLASPAGDGVDRPRISVADYVRAKGGNRVVTKILIANNGIAAVKAIRSIRKWAYETFGNDHAIEFVAMATPDDLKANAAYIHLADEFVSVPGGSNNNNYANIQLITDIAERTGASAVWAGWGHASENPKLPEMLSTTRNGVVWMGPPPSAMRALGDKIGSTLIAQTAGVPCMAWSGAGIEVNYASEGIPDDKYRQACVTTAAEAKASADQIGYPIMIKASEGGGGKGIRRVTEPEQVDLAFSQVQGEVPGSPIFLMALAPTCRHLEVQLLADAHGEAIAIFGRDCSIQRRHQKIIEEGPVVAAPPAIWRHMEQSAVKLAKTVGYVGAGTVEYLYIDSGIDAGKYYFLELNPRLQVEHPVTEMISGVNLPAAQLQVAMGIPLHNIRGVRRMYGEDADTSKVINFEECDDKKKTLPLHVIACRITAENPDAEFQPTSGVIQELNFRSTPDVWGYFSVAARGGVHEFSDSQFGHMFAIGENREIARRNMVLALKELSIRGDIRTTVEYLREILETSDYRRNKISTTWLEQVMAKRQVVTEKPETHLAVILGALFRAFKFQSLREKEFMETLNRGQLPSPTLHADCIEVKMELIYEKTKYVLLVIKTGPSTYDLTLNNRTVSVEAHALSDDGLLVLLDAKKHVVYGQEFPSGLRLTVDGKTCLFHEEYDPTQLRAAMQGKLVRYLIGDGVHVAKDKPYAEIEVMKMYVTLTAPESGILKPVKPEGSVLEAGDLIATLTLDDPARVQKAELFSGQFPIMREPSLIGESPNQILKHTIKQLQMLLSGYSLHTESMKHAVNEMMQCLRDPRLPLEQFREILSTLSGRIPQQLHDDFTNTLNNYQSTQTSNHRFYWETPDPFPVLELQNAIDRAGLLLAQANNEAGKQALLTQLKNSGVTPLLQAYKEGNHGYALTTLSSLFNEYYHVEQHFNTDESNDAVIKSLRKLHKDDLKPVASISKAHFLVAKRNALVLMLLEVIEQQLNPLIREFLPTLRQLASLASKETAAVSLQSRQLIVRQELPSSSQRRIAIETILTAASTSTDTAARKERLAPLIDQSQPIEDLIFTFFESKRPTIQSAAMEAYIRRVYQVYALPHVEVNLSKEHGGKLTGRWEFFMDNANRTDEDEATPTGRLSPSASPHDRLSVLTRSTSAHGSINGGSPNGSPNPTSTSPLPSISISASPIQGAHNPVPSPTGTLTSRQKNEYLMRKIDSVRSLSNITRQPPTSSMPPSAFATPSERSATGAQEHSLNSNSGDEEWREDVLALPARMGVMTFFSNFDAAKAGFSDCLMEFDLAQSFIEPVHVLYVGFKWASGKLPSDDQISEYLRIFIQLHDHALKEKGVRRVTFIVTQERSEAKEDYPMYFTFRSQQSYEEDTLVRHIEPCYALHMQLQRLHNFDLRFVPTPNRMVHLFAAYPASQPGQGVTLHSLPPSQLSKELKNTPYDGRRLFVRSIIRKVDSVNLYRVSDPNDIDLDAHPETEVAFVEALNSLELAMGNDSKQWRQNSIFLNILVEIQVDTDYIEAVIRLLSKRYSDKVRRCNVSNVEFTVTIKPSADSTVAHPYRFVCFNPTGYVLHIDTYQERRDATGKIVFKYTKKANDKSEYVGVWDGADIYTPYPVHTPFTKQRDLAQAMETVYVYDLIPLFERAVAKVWEKRGRATQRPKRSRGMSVGEGPLTMRAQKQDLAVPAEIHVPDMKLSWVELVLAPSSSSSTPPPTTSSAHWTLVESKRAPGSNDIGMVAWRVTLRTPEYPSGRDLVIISNDITHQAGTFGPMEDILFDLASKYARARAIPRIYVAANSGARIGLAEELRNKFKVAFVNDDPSKGFLYLYLTAADHEALNASVIATAVTTEGGETRYQIRDIVGAKNGLGVENLRGSGMIAGETSLAYEAIFTLTYVTGRTVGIGAYLARLGQRVIQKAAPPQPIILTGYNALNKLLGRQVYNSNVQLGGPEIMYTNGVSHLVVNDDLDGVSAILKWLSFVPHKRLAPLPVLPSFHVDPVERKITFKPSKAAYDPRHMLAGVYDEQQGWLSGFFDRDSWTEMLAGWAKTVITGRARLGGIPVGVVAVETRTVEQIIPADPSSPDSKEQVSQRAGQVWYPDSAFKTAQAIKDLKAEDLPLIIFANWRGFSGGMKDMFEEILKFGSYIVDALREYQQPICVYLPPHATLRGGAWVVVDQTINPSYMEMFADESARAGVLETEGTLDVKFRKKDIIAQAHRLDTQLQALDAELANKTRDPAVVQKEIAARESVLYPVYYQVATQFADLHDTPGRMQSKGCIEAAVPWERARAFFYYRLTRRMAEVRYIKSIAAITGQVVDPSLSPEQIFLKARETFHSFVEVETKGQVNASDDKAFVQWLTTNTNTLERSIEKLRQGVFAQRIKSLLNTYDRRESEDAGTDHTVDGLVAVIKALDSKQKKQLEELFLAPALAATQQRQ